MEPAILEGSDILITEKVEALERGDIVVFWLPDDPSKSLIKRIVGLGGEMIDMNKDGQITINGVPPEEAYVLPDRNQMARERWSMVRSDWKVVKPHYYFVMGDNRDTSNDSRSWGLVPEKYIWGKVVEPR